MKPFICHVHGEIEPRIWNTPKRISRQCPICRVQNFKRRYEKQKRENPNFSHDFYQKYIKGFKAYSLKSIRDRKIQIINGYGGKCECCGETNFEFLTLDHINGGGNKERTTTAKGFGLYRRLIKEGFPREGYRLLCMNCNFSLGKYGYCPHKKTEQGCPQDS
jgi:hypothetical protein